MDNFKIRLIKEIQDLEYKIKRLDKFSNFENKTYINLDDIEQELLKQQYEIMCEYHSILKTRLMIINTKNKEN